MGEAADCNPVVEIMNPIVEIRTQEKTMIIIRTRGDRRLYESLAREFDSETRHRTERAAGKRLLAIDKDWSRATTGITGSVEIEVDGKVLHEYDASGFENRAKTLADPDYWGKYLYQYPERLR